MNKLEEIKDFLLYKYPFYNNGYANVNKPNDTNIIIDEKESNYVGIADNLGNYFYIRSLKESTYNQLRNGFTNYSKTTQCRIVSLCHNLVDEIIEQSLINGLSEKKVIIKNSTLDKTKVFKEETGTNNMNDRIKHLSLISIDFEVTELVNTRNCGTINPSKNC